MAARARSPLMTRRNTRGPLRQLHQGGARSPVDAACVHIKPLSLLRADAPCPPTRRTQASTSRPNWSSGSLADATNHDTVSPSGRSWWRRRHVVAKADWTHGGPQPPPHRQPRCPPERSVADALPQNARASSTGGVSCSSRSDEGCPNPLARGACPGLSSGCPWRSQAACLRSARPRVRRRPRPASGSRPRLPAA